MTTGVTDVFILAFTMLPTMVLFAKITPDHIEATIFAVLTGMFNFCNGWISPNMGILINQSFVGVSSGNLQNYYVLVMITLGMSLTPLIFVRLIPLKRDLKIEEKPSSPRKG